MPDDEKDPKKPKGSRLTQLIVREISLVDDPAVPAARFLIAKRKDAAMPKNETKNVDVKKNEGEMPPEGVAALTEHLDQLEAILPTLPPEYQELCAAFIGQARAMQGKGMPQAGDQNAGDNLEDDEEMDEEKLAAEAKAAASEAIAELEGFANAKR